MISPFKISPDESGQMTLMFQLLNISNECKSNSVVGRLHNDSSVIYKGLSSHQYFFFSLAQLKVVTLDHLK